MSTEQTESTPVRRYIPRELDAALSKAAVLRETSVQEYLVNVVLPFVREDIDSSVRSIVARTMGG